MCYEGHAGPVYKVQRNLWFPKYFVTIGDWTWRIWNEDVKVPVMSSKYHMSYILDACWSPARPGVLLTSNMEGVLDVWDIFHKQNEPCLSMQVDNDGLYSLSLQDTGDRLCTGSADGSVYMLELSEGLTTLQRNEKAQISAMFDRETKREKNLDAIAKAKKVAERNAALTAKEPAKEPGVPWEDKQKEVEDAFWAAVRPAEEEEQ